MPNLASRLAALVAFPLTLVLSAAPAPVRAQATALPADDGGPPNAPLTAAVRDGHLTLSYDGRVLFAGAITGGRAELRTLVDTSDGAVTQVLKWTVRDGPPLRIAGRVRASGDAFPCEADPRPDAPPIVRNGVGPTDNRLNRAVYDRRRDWVLSVDVPAGVRVVPLATSPDSSVYRFEVTGAEVALRFRPRFYERHRGLAWFRPWTYDVWHRSVAGWTSWFAFLDTVTEADIERTADVLSQELRPYGYDYLQIDDGYERSPVGPPRDWLTTNAKFPSGLAGLRRYIAGRGLEPALWTNVSFQDSAYAYAHPDEFVRTRDGRPALGNWIGYPMDASNPATLRDLVLPVYDSLAHMGWRYLKLDALRHLRYEGYNSHADYFRRRGLDRVAVYRSFVQAVRDAIGRNTFLLACWGIRPELAGLVDAVRVGTDGFGYGGFAEYNSFNNVVWRNDPDHIQLTAPDAYRAATLTSLTGSLLMLTDRPEVYRTERVEIARRTAPVLFTQPEQIYDVDPSRSSRLHDADVAVSGSGPRPLDADRRLVAPLYQLDIARPFERWTVLARTAGDEASLRFAELGLDPDSEHVVFEFWSKMLLGDFRGSFTPPPIDPRFGVQVFCIRHRVAHPQLVATNRHVTCGGVDLVDVRWHDGALEGESDVVANDTYELYLTEPAGYRFTGATASGAAVVSATRAGALRIVRLRASQSGRVRWSVRWTGAA